MLPSSRPFDAVKRCDHLTPSPGWRPSLDQDVAVTEEYVGDVQVAAEEHNSYMED